MIAPPASPRSSRAPSADPRTTSALELFVVLSRAHAALLDLASADAARHGLTIAEFAILEALYHKGPMLLGEIQRRILVSSGGITFLVDRLEQKGLVERQACEDDGRARYAALRPEGERLMRRIFPGHASLIAQACGSLTEKEKRSVTALLKSLGKAARSIEETMPPPKKRPRTARTARTP